VNNQKASLTIASLAAGAHSITATYSGDTNFLGSSSSALSQTVNGGGTTTTVNLTFTPQLVLNNVLFRRAVTCKATVSPGTAMGQVVFIDGTRLLGTATVNTGVATLPVKQLAIGRHAITAAYGGDGHALGGSISTPAIFYSSPKPH
jgi:hypothetical protein